jgi:hypothetical protein
MPPRTTKPALVRTSLGRAGPIPGHSLSGDMTASYRHQKNIRVDLIDRRDICHVSKRDVT